MRTEPRALVRRLTPTARRHLEGAVTAAALARHDTLGPEHVLHAIVADDQGDAAVLLTAEERAAVRAELEHVLGRAPRGGARPSLSDALVRWLEQAWLVGSLAWQEAAIRSGALLVAFLERAQNETGSAPAIAGIPLDRVRATRAEALARSPESGELARRVPASEDSGPGGASALARFTTSLTGRARAGELDAVLGRERETQQLVHILCRRRKNNPVLVGEPGVGKTAIVEGLALAIVRGEVPEPLRDVDLRGLDMGLLSAGAGARGELEARLTGVIREVQASSVPIILFIDEAHTLVGAQPNGGTDAANLLKPALARGELRTIAATTFREHKKYFERDAALERRFQKVSVEEPDERRAIAMLRGLVPIYERAHGVPIRSEAVEAAVRLSKRYVAGRQLPDSCVDVLDTTLARVRAAQLARPVALVELDAELEDLERERAALERERLERPATRERRATLESRVQAVIGQRVELEARWSAQRGALERLLGARAALRDVPSGPSSEALRREREIEVRVAQEAFDAAAGERPLIAAEVDASAIAATIESWTGVPVGDLQRARTDALRDLESALDRRVIGQHEATRAIADGLRVAHAGLRPREAPAGVFLLVGPSGVGKSETARAIADLLYGGERFLTTINLSEYQEKHTVSRLVGSPPGYVGYGEGGKLTEAVRLRPHSVVLLDECEKADLEVLNVFYQLLDRGVLADGEGRVIDFRSTVVLLTSNLASERIAELALAGVTDRDEIERAIRPSLAAHFAPALLGRMTVVPYVPLSGEAIGAIVEMELGRVAERVALAHRITLRVGPRLSASLARTALDPSAGVRRLRTELERLVLAPLASELLAPPGAASGARGLEAESDDVGSVRFTWSHR